MKCASLKGAGPGPRVVAWSLQQFTPPLLLRDGQIAELGTHDDLMSRNGSYADLMRAQEFAA